MVRSKSTFNLNVSLKISPVPYVFSILTAFQLYNVFLWALSSFNLSLACSFSSSYNMLISVAQLNCQCSECFDDLHIFVGRYL